nr:hypothetical protein [uncultured Niameybacter sp.]
MTNQHNDYAVIWFVLMNKTHAWLFAMHESFIFVHNKLNSHKLINEER